MSPKGARIAKVSRETKETRVIAELKLDGQGASRCEIPDDFLKHMVETLAKYSGVELKISARGDIAHHLIEDVAEYGPVCDRDKLLSQRESQRPEPSAFSSA